MKGDALARYVASQPRSFISLILGRFRLRRTERSTLMVSRKALLAINIYARRHGISVAAATQMLLTTAFEEELKNSGRQDSNSHLE